MRDNGLRGSIKTGSLSYQMFGVGWPDLTLEQRRHYNTEWARRNKVKITATRHKNRERYNAAAREKMRDPAYRAEVRRKEREWRASNPSVVKRYYRRYRLKSEYGLSEGQYDAMVQAQGGKCAICHSTRAMPDHSPRRDEKLHVDHDHATGKVRGLLCHHCNMVLGHFKEDIARLHNAIAYLLAHRQTEVA